VPTQNRAIDQFVSGVLLAAGSSRRMGRPKQLLDWGGSPLVRVAAEQALAAGLQELIVVTGAAHAEIAAALAGLPLRLVYNPEHAQGQSTSLRAGIGALGQQAAATLVLLGDQPFVTAAIVGRIVGAWRASGAPIVAPRYRGTRGNPVLFARELFPELLAVTGDQGARAILAARSSTIHFVDIDDDRPLADIDTPDDYIRATQDRE
jgi:molybdenum cofactor cytidylyltransferase